MWIQGQTRCTDRVRHPGNECQLNIGDFEGRALSRLDGVHHHQRAPQHLHLPPHHSHWPPSFSSFSSPTSVTHPLDKVHQEHSAKQFIFISHFTLPYAAILQTERNCESASCTVVITSHRISLLSQSTSCWDFNSDWGFTVGCLIPPWIRPCCCGLKD